MMEFLFNLFNLESGDLSTPGGWTLRFASPWSTAVLVLGSIALVLLVWQVYRRERGRASARYKAMLAALRIIALAVLVLALLAPTVVVRRSKLQESYVPILLDVSDSMGLSDRYRDDELVARLAQAIGLTDGLELPPQPEIAERVRSMSRAEIANAIFSRPEYDLIERIGEASRVRPYLFATGLTEASSLEIEPSGPATAVGANIRAAIERLRGQRIAAMVVVSDWDSNTGIDPLEAAQDALAGDPAFPIFAVGVGDPTPQHDIEVLALSAQQEARVGDRLEFVVNIEQDGFTGEPVPLQLRKDDREVAREEITLRPPEESGRYRITYTPEKPGVYTYTAVVPEQDGEVSGANNEAQTTVTVRDNKVRVLLVSAQPTWEWRYLRGALVRDETVELDLWLQSAADGWAAPGGNQINYFPQDEKDLVDNYDTIILLGASPRGFSERQLENIVTFVDRFGGGLIFQAGSLVENEGFAGTPLEKCLPVYLEPPPEFPPTRPRQSSFRPRVTPEGWASPVTALTEDEAQNRRLWDSLPGFFWFHPVSDVKSIAQVIAVRPGDTLMMDDGESPFPIFAEQRYGKGRVFFSATDELWRWRFLVGDKYFYRFWRRVIDRVGDRVKRLDISIPQARYAVGDTIEIIASSVDEALRPSSAEWMDVHLDRPVGRSDIIRLQQDPGDKGTYRGTTRVDEPGSYTVWAQPDPGQDRETASFTVETAALEEQSVRLHYEVMRSVADKTAGEAFMIHDADRIPDMIEAQSEHIWEGHPRSIWDSWGFLILFVTPLSLEWWLRKRRLLT